MTKKGIKMFLTVILILSVQFLYGLVYERDSLHDLDYLVKVIYSEHHVPSVLTCIQKCSRYEGTNAVYKEMNCKCVILSKNNGIKVDGDFYKSIGNPDKSKQPEISDSVVKEKEFSCIGRSNGIYTMCPSRISYHCVGGLQFENKCKSDQLFDPVTERCKDALRVKCQCRMDRGYCFFIR